MKKKKSENAVFTEKGIEVRSPCGRAWFIPADKIRDDYAEFLMEADKLDKETALAQASNDESFLRTWFAEQFNWADVDRLGRLIKEPTAEEIKSALDFIRNSGSAPFSDFETHNLPE